MYQFQGWQNIQLASDYADLYECTDIIADDNKRLAVRIRNGIYPYRDLTIRITQMPRLPNSEVVYYFLAYEDDKCDLMQIYLLDIQAMNKDKVWSKMMNNIIDNSDGTGFYWIRLRDLQKYIVFEYKKEYK